jgi:hypothetical protein
MKHKCTNIMRDNMKKVLLASSALALVGAIASPAAAADWDVRVGGYMEQYIAYADNNVDRVPGGDGDLNRID